MTTPPHAELVRHQRMLDVADEMDALADGIPWPTTKSLLRQGASSLRWQVTWDRKHPSHNEQVGDRP